MKNELTTQDELTDFLLYNTPNGNVKVETLLHNENIWLPQKHIAELFGKSRTTITEHLNNIFKENELDEQVVCRNFRLPTQHGAIKGKTQNTNTKYYNLDAILSDCLWQKRSAMHPSRNSKKISFRYRRFYKRCIFKSVA